MPEKKGQRLILADGTTFENDSCGYSSGHLWCWLHGKTMQEAAALFLDASKTARIVYEYGEMSDVYDGFTVCTNIFIDYGEISVCLVKGE